MRFGAFLPQGWRLDLVGIEPENQWQTMLDFAGRREAGSWDLLWIYDHFHTLPVPTEETTHEAWSLMAALAATTQRVRLGQMCYCMAYRNPGHLAKVAATCDVISGGRVEMGIGGGWYEHEWRAYGYGFRPPGGRSARHARPRRADHASGVDGRRRHARREALPGGRRSRPAAATAGRRHPAVDRRRRREEDATHRGEARAIHQLRHHPTFTRKSDILAQHCRDVGRDFAEITRSDNYNLVICETEQDVKDKLDWIHEHYARTVPADQAERTRKLFADGPLVGTPEQLVERLREAEGVGLTYAIRYVVDAIYDPVSLEPLTTRVIPELA